MSLLGKKIRLKPNSQKGKNRINSFGSDWQVLAETDHVLFAPGVKGPWLFICPVGQNQDHAGSRWIHLINDKDFEVAVNQVDNNLS